MKKAIIIPCLIASLFAFGQEEPKDTIAVSVGGYADAYYAYYVGADKSALQQHECIGAYHNNFGLNTAQVTAAIQSDRLRGVLTLHQGDIASVAWSDNYRLVQEANAGIRLAKGLWFDVGYFKTHLGTESFLPKDNALSFITLATFYGPFYQGGARLAYETEKELHIELHAINGYNLHIDNNEYKSFGLLVSRPFGDKLYLSYSNLLGQERVGALDDGYLVYQNAYANLTFDRLFVQLGVDVATADQWKTGQGWLDPLVAGLVTVKYNLTNDFAIAMRAEVFSDEQNINSFAYTPRVVPTWDFGSRSVNSISGGMTVYGVTLGAEYAPSPYGFLRVEARQLYNPQAPLSKAPDGYDASVAGMNPMLTSRLQLMATAGFYFDKTFKFAR